MTRTLDRDAPKVVVGVNGSPQSRLALRWAAAEAVRRHARLHVVHAYAGDRRPVAVRPERAAIAAHSAENVFAMAFDEVHVIHPDLVVTGCAVPGGAAKALLAASEPGGLVVVGGSGRSDMAVRLGGSTCEQVAAHAEGSVVVVRNQPGHHGGPVVAGYDGSGAAWAALECAFDAAAARRTALTVMCAVNLVTWARSRDDKRSPAAEVHAARTAVAAELRHAVAPLTTKYPQTPVRYRVVEGAPADALVHASHRARLLVVGSRGRGTIVGLLLGSVGLHLLHHAYCPVLIGR